MSEQDDFPERFHRDRREHGGASQYLDNDQDEQLARLTEEERVAAGLDAYDRDEVPPATDTPPQPEDITQNEDWQEERAEFRREEDKGELGHINASSGLGAWREGQALLARLIGTTVIEGPWRSPVAGPTLADHETLQL